MPMTMCTSTGMDPDPSAFQSLIYWQLTMLKHHDYNMIAFISQ